MQMQVEENISIKKKNQFLLLKGAPHQLGSLVDLNYF